MEKQPKPISSMIVLGTHVALISIGLSQRQQFSVQARESSSIVNYQSTTLSSKRL